MRSTLNLTAVFRLIIIVASVNFALAATGWALTVEESLTPDYVKEHPKEWSVNVADGKDGQITFTVIQYLVEPKYLVAHFAAYHGGNLVATSDSPAFGRKRDNTFYFSVARDDLADSKFSLSESVVGGSGDDAVPLPGTIIHHIALKDFFAARSDRGGPDGSPAKPSDKETGAKDSNEPNESKASNENLLPLIDKVLTAYGGEETLNQIKAMTLELRTPGSHGKASTTKYFVELPDKYRIEFGREGDAAKEIQIILGQDRIRRWRKHADGKVEELIFGGLDYPREYWLDEVKYFGPRTVLRLKDSDCKLSPLDGIKLNDRAAAGIALAKTGSPVEFSLKMYFDKEIGLLLWQNNTLQQYETVYSDYKTIDGLPIPGRTTDIHSVGVGREMKESTKSELVDFKPFDKLDPKLFQEP
jgi:hypothetical protein